MDSAAHPMAARDPSPATPAYLYLLYGEDEFSRSEQVAGLREKMARLPAGEYNITVLNGAETSVDEIIAACEAVPFLADRRMVIVNGLLGRWSGRPPARGGRERKARSGDSDETLAQFLGALRRIPPTTALVLVEGPLDDALVARLSGDRTVVRRFDPPKGERLVRWLQQRARVHDTELDGEAARVLAAETDDLRALDSELAKLSLYCQGRVDVDAVRLLVPSGELTIFALLDAVAERRGGDALSALHNLYRHGQRPEAILAQLASLVRRLLIIKELARSGPPSASQAAAHGLNPNALPKLQRQAKLLSADELEAALRRLLDADRASKTGRMDAELAVELAVAELARVASQGRKR